MQETLEATPPEGREWLGLVPIVAGLCWLLLAETPAEVLLVVLPAILLISSGSALLLMPGDRRIVAMMAAGAVIGAMLSPVAWIVAGLDLGFYGLLGSVLSLMTAGRLGLFGEPHAPGAQPPDRSTAMDLKAGIDEALLGYFVGTATFPRGAEAERIAGEAIALDVLMQERGWHQDPSGLHPAPPPPAETFVERARLWGTDYEVLSFDSGFEPPPDLPGAERWNSFAANRNCHVRILRHPGPPRPWLMCIHGYRMGVPWMDLGMFSPGWLHHGLGLNVIQPVLPLHGPRRAGARSGDYYLDGDPLDLIHAQMQALWDLRRTLAWLREHEPQARVGVFGISLGGYNAALLSTYEPDLEFVIAGIPVIDFASALWRFLPPAQLRYFTARGLDEAKYRQLLAPVSPLSRPPLPETSRLQIVAATGDRVVLAPNPLALSTHWGVPVQWYQGSHLSVRRERAIRIALRQAMQRAGWPEPH